MARKRSYSGPLWRKSAFPILFGESREKLIRFYLGFVASKFNVEKYEKSGKKNELLHWRESSERII